MTPTKKEALDRAEKIQTEAQNNIRRMIEENPHLEYQDGILHGIYLKLAELELKIEELAHRNAVYGNTIRNL